jgi:hypothetical protein
MVITDRYRWKQTRARRRVEQIRAKKTPDRRASRVGRVKRRQWTDS